MQEKDFNAWNLRKKEVHAKDFQGYIHEREIWWCSLGLNIGDEEDGKNELYERPVLVIKKFNRNIVLTVPLTTRVKANKYYYPFEHEGVMFAVILSQLRLTSTKRMTRRIRKIDQVLFRKIKEAVKAII